MIFFVVGRGRTCTDTMAEDGDMRAALGYIDNPVWPVLGVLHPAHRASNLHEQHSSFQHPAGRDALSSAVPQQLVARYFNKYLR